MPPHLHPRSSATTTLFASTLAASFIIVGIPHIFPCPAPRKGYLDAEGNIGGKSRRRKRESNDGVAIDRIEGHEKEIRDKAAPGLVEELRLVLGESGGVSSNRKGTRSGAATSQSLEISENAEHEARSMFKSMEQEAAALERERRECPVPKPGGRLGQMLGFGRDGRESKGEKDR